MSGRAAFSGINLNEGGMQVWKVGGERINI
jgi:hypothetical protein